MWRLRVCSTATAGLHAVYNTLLQRDQAPVASCSIVRGDQPEPSRRLAEQRRLLQLSQIFLDNFNYNMFKLVSLAP